MAFWSVNKGLTGFFVLMGLLMIIIGFIVAPESRTDDGHPLNIFLWGFGSFWILFSLGTALVVRQMTVRRMRRLSTWLPGKARVLSASETGTYINNMPRIRFTLEVTCDAHGVYQTEHREVVSLLHLASYAEGTTHEVRVNPDNPKNIVFAN
jgi:hypothetical protein